jgi:hypothetical protein
MNKIQKQKRRQKGDYVTTTIKLSQKCLKMVEKAYYRKQNMQSMSAFVEATVRPYIGQYTVIRRDYRKYKLIRKTFTFTAGFIAGIKGCQNVSTYIEQELMKRIKG